MTWAAARKASNLRSAMSMPLEVMQLEMPWAVARCCS
jgi:hypothetical protein